MNESGPVDDQIVKIILAGNDLQKQRIDHKDQKGYGKIDHRYAQKQAEGNQKAEPLVSDLFPRNHRCSVHIEKGGYLADPDDNTEDQRQKIRQPESFPLNHHDSVVNQKQRHNQKCERCDHNHPCQGYILVRTEQK